MKSTPALAFLSCSFQEADTPLNDHIRAICEGLDIKCINVKDGYADIPPAKAKDMINEAQFVIAIAVKRNREEDNTYTMPHAVHDEISMAFGMEKPLLLIKEVGVGVKGFIGNYGTFLEFDRSEIKEPEFLRRVITSIHTLKLDVISSHDLLPDQDSSGFYQESFSALYELLSKDGGFTWKYSVSRRLLFTQKHQSVIRNSAWVTIQPEDIDPASRIEHSLKYEGGSKAFRLEQKIDRDTAQCIETSFSILPPPEKGDYVQVSHSYESPNLNQIHKTPAGDINSYDIGEHSYHCFDGVVPIVRTQHMRFQFRFPKEYGLRKEDIFPFVGSYSAGIDYLVDSELKRSTIEIEDFGGNLQIDFRVESPLLRHLYGIAWCVPE